MDRGSWSRFSRRRTSILGLLLVVLVVGTAFVGPWFTPHDPDQQFRDELLDRVGAPAGLWERPGHPLGADPIGRDELSRLLDGGKVSLTVALGATALATLLGLLAGVVAGFFGGWWDSLLMRFVDLLLSLPFLLIAIALQSVIDEPGLWTLCLVLGFLSWTTLARVTRSKTKQVRGLDYVQAARALGLPPWRIILRHVVPNVMSPVIVLATILVANMIIAESALSYLGIGVAPPKASWGNMLREGQEMLMYAPRLVLLPGSMILVAVVGFNLMGEGLRDALDPND